MALDPIIVNIQPPKSPWFKRLPKFPKFSPKQTKILTIAAAAVIILSMVLIVGATVLTNNSKFKKSHNIATAADKAEVQKNAAALPGGGEVLGKGAASGTDAPDIVFKAEHGSVTVGQQVKLSWTTTKNPTCVATEDWSGPKPISGFETTPVLSQVKTYEFVLTCKTKTGTRFSKINIGATQAGTPSVAGAPMVTFAASPVAIYTGQTTTLSWSSTNNATSCAASGDWGGSKAGSGSATIGPLTTAKTYTYSISCKNSTGTSSLATTQVLVSDAPVDMPVILMTKEPATTLLPGASVKISWEVTNNPKTCTASGDWSGTKAFTGSATIGPLATIKNYTYVLSCSNAQGTVSDANVVVQVLPDVPTVNLTVSPANINTGASATLNWSTTNNPTSCTAGGDWSGTKANSGSQSTGVLNTARTYNYSLKCVNQATTAAGVTDTATLVVAQPVPVVTINASPITTTTGNSSTITWSATNSPTSCTASGDWSGTKAGSSSQSTGTLNTAKTYTYNLTCTNATGTSSMASTSVSVTASGAPVVAPVITISAAPTSIGTGSSSLISWSATNSPTSCTSSGQWGASSRSASGSTSTGAMNTAGTYTYTLTCSNSAGSDTKSATVTVIAIPVVTVTITPASISTGSAATISWSATNSPTSCTSSGQWGASSRASSGSVSTGTMGTAGSYTYTLNCTNAGGTGTNSKVLTVSAAYCSGNTPCYGPADLALHNTTTNCWGYNGNRVVDVTSLNNGYHKAQQGNLLPNATICGNVNMSPYLSGSSSISGIGSHNHGSAPKNNTGRMASYLVGYYDATKP